MDYEKLVALIDLVWSNTIQLRLSNPVSLFRIDLPCISVCKLTALYQFIMELNTVAAAGVCVIGLQLILFSSVDCLR